jgi:hypothetical protein
MAEFEIRPSVATSLVVATEDLVVHTESFL